MAAVSGRFVLDSYAVLSLLDNEPGSEAVVSILEAGEADSANVAMTTVNVGEVLYIVERERGLFAAQQTLARLDEMPIQIVTADRELTVAAAHLKANLAIAYADCFAIALARLRDATVVTGDREFAKAEGLVRVQWLTK